MCSGGWRRMIAGGADVNAAMTMTGVSCLYPAAAWLPVLLLVFRRASSLSLSLGHGSTTWAAV